MDAVARAQLVSMAAQCTPPLSSAVQSLTLQPTGMSLQKFALQPEHCHRGRGSLALSRLSAMNCG